MTHASRTPSSPNENSTPSSTPRPFIPRTTARPRRGKPYADSGSALLRFWHVWRADVSGFAAPTASARNDRDDGFGHEPLPLLNRLPRRVSASRHPKGAYGGSAEERLPHGAHQRAGPHHARLRRKTDQGRHKMQSGRSLEAARGRL